jgi:hypothetical protein
MGWKAGLCAQWLGVADLPDLPFRLFPTHSAIQSCPKGEGCAHVLTRSLHFALLRFELRLAGVPLCPAWLSLFMRRGETDGQIFQPPHEAKA